MLDIRLAPARAFSAIIPTGTLSEILVDKIHAMACREYPKPRDIFDLWLIVNGNGLRVPAQHEAWSEALARHGQMYRSLPIEEFPPRLRERAAYFGAQAGRCAAIKDLQRWLIGVNLADDLLRSMLDQTVKSIVEIADLIEKELNQPVPVASHRESSGNG